MASSTPGIVIETQRLLLRCFVDEDEPLLIQCLTDADFMAYAPSGVFAEAAAKIRFQQLKNAVADNGFGKLAIIVKATQQLIGYCGIEACVLDGGQELELGYRLIRSARRCGYATEAAQALLHYYKNRGVNDIMAFTEPQNAASIRVLKKLGYLAKGLSVYQGMPIVIFRR